MNKKFRLLLLSIVFVTVTTVAVFAAGKVIEFVARAEFKAPVLAHTPITNVSSISKELNAGVIVDFGIFSYATAKAELIYSLDNSANITVAYSGTIKNNEQFFISADVGDHSNVKYQIKVSFENSGKTLYELYSPEDKSFYNVTVSNSTSGTIGSDGGTIVYDDGNQETGNSGVVVQPGTFDDETEIIIEELDFGGVSPVSGLRSVSKVADTSSSYGKFGTAPINGIGVSTKDGKTSWPAIDGFINLKGATGTKFTVVYRENASADINTWEVIKVEKIEDGSVWFKISKAGQYLVFASNELADKNHRPVRRTIVKGRIGQNYPGFEFQNIDNGDVLKIFSVNGKKIAEVSSSDNTGKLVWNGRKDNGDWAKSGIYVYQIKVKETGKLISGTIVFVY